MITKEFLQLEYIDKNRTAADIAKEISLSDTQVRYWVHKHGLQIHPRGGTSKTKSLVDRQFDKLKVLHQVKGNGTSAVWRCECKCGNFTNVTSGCLRRREIKSCGKCPRDITIQGQSKLEAYGGLSGQHFGSIKNNAKKRNLQFDITREYLWKLFLSQNGICRLSGRYIVLSYDTSIKTASLDRIDSSLGYIEGNVQWVHVDFNLMKSNYTQSEFIQMCKEVANNHE